jgi:hypothetical protein
MWLINCPTTAGTRQGRAPIRQTRFSTTLGIRILPMAAQHGCALSLEPRSLPLLFLNVTPLSEPGVLPRLPAMNREPEQGLRGALLSERKWTRCLQWRTSSGCN